MCSVAQLCPTLNLYNQWTVPHQAPLSMEFSRQEYWSGLLFSTAGDLPSPGIKPAVSCITRQILHHYAWEVGREATREALLPKLGEPQTSSSTIRVETLENTRNMCLKAGGLCKGQLESLLDNISSLSSAFGQRSGPSSSSSSR